MRPSEEAIRKVMEETKMDYLQAYRHVQQRTILREMCRSGQMTALRSKYSISTTKEPL